MAATMVTSADFLDDVIRNTIISTSAFIDDTKEMVYYNRVLSNFNIDRDNEYLPDVSALSVPVKNYLVICTTIDVCYANNAGDMSIILNDTGTSLFEIKMKAYTDQRADALLNITSTDIYDSDNLPDDDDDESDSSSTFTWGRC